MGKLSGQSEIEYLILDGIITQRLLDAAKKAEIKYVIGHRVAKLTNDDGITLKTFTTKSNPPSVPSINRISVSYTHLTLPTILLV